MVIQSPYSTGSRCQIPYQDDQCARIAKLSHDKMVMVYHAFDFQLVHMPANCHKVVDGLSQKRPTKYDSEEDAKQWLDQVCGTVEVVAPDKRTDKYQTFVIQELYDDYWRELGQYLEMQDTSGMSKKMKQAVKAKAMHFFIQDRKIYRRVKGEMPREVIGRKDQRLEMSEQ